MRCTAEAILFDNDGVLVDSHAQVVQAWRQLADEFDIDYEKMADELVGKRAVDTLSRHLPASRLDDAVSRLEDLEVELADQTRPLTGALELLSTLDQMPWAIATSATRRLALARWSGAGIDVPEVTVTAEEVERGKPDPQPYLLAAQRLGVDPTRCVVFEDSSAGGEAAKAAGAAVVAVGGQAWSFEPTVRIPDLTAVGCSPEPSGQFGLEFEA